MKYNKIKLFIYSIIILSFIILGEYTALAQAASVSQGTKLWDSFTYEHQGQSLDYSIVKLPTDIAMGEVNLLGPKDKSGLTGNLYIPDIVSLNGASYLVKSIGLRAFAYCNYITSVNIPEGITEINQEAFYSCDSLTEVTIADSVKHIGSNAFASNKKLFRIKLSKNITRIPSSAFWGCTALESIDIPDGVTTIETFSFQNCKNLQRVRIPDTVTGIDRDAFNNINTLFSVAKGSYAARFCKGFTYQCNYYTDTSETSIPLDEIILKKRLVTLFSGEKTNLSLMFYPSNTTENKTTIWSSDNPEIASVNSNGIITAKKSGQTIISAVSGTKSAICIIVVKPETPQAIKAVSSGIDSIKITWDPVVGANGYRIFRSKSKSGNYEAISYIYKAAYEDKSLEKDTTYYYKVYAYISRLGYYEKSHFSKIASAQPKLGIPLTSASSESNHSIKLSWNYISGADGYDIYRSASKNGTFKLYKSITSDYFIDSSLTKGKTYYYYVKAYYTKKNKKVYSDASKKVSALAAAPPTPKYVTLGTSKEDVYKILGKPSGKYYSPEEDALVIYYYKDYLINYKAVLFLERIHGVYSVSSWGIEDSGIKISDGDETDSGTFTLGSTFKDVAKAMDTSPLLSMTYSSTKKRFDFKYGKSITYGDGSCIGFDEDLKVIGWINKGSLKVKYGADKPTHASITIGTPLKDVIKALGTPDALDSSETGYPEYLSYGETKLYFDSFQKLSGWSNKGKLNISIGEKAPSAHKVVIGSTFNEVIKAMGTPNSFGMNRGIYDKIEAVTYKNMVIYFDDNLKVSQIVANN